MFNPGDRVQWKYDEPNADPSELRGKVVVVEPRYRVRWDDGSEEWVDSDDIEPENK